MNEVKIPETRLIELVNHEKILADLLQHFYENREVSKAYEGSKVVAQSTSYNIDQTYIDELLVNNMKGFKEEIEDEV